VCSSDLLNKVVISPPGYDVNCFCRWPDDPMARSPDAL
jgi:hypothetical protein